MSTPDDRPWHAIDPLVQEPIPTGRVEVRLRDGTIITTDARNLRWEITGAGGDILEWRPAYAKAGLS